MQPKARIDIDPGLVVELHEAGGGGFGDPAARSTELVKRDLDAGLITPEYVRRFYSRQASEVLGERKG